MGYKQIKLYFLKIVVMCLKVSLSPVLDVCLTATDFVLFLPFKFISKNVSFFPLLSPFSYAIQHCNPWVFTAYTMSSLISSVFLQYVAFVKNSLLILHFCLTIQFSQYFSQKYLPSSFNHF